MPFCGFFIFNIAIFPMKMKLLVFVFSALFAHTAEAQGDKASSAIVLDPSAKDTSKMQVADSANLRIWYAMNAVDINKPETHDDLQRLEIGSRLSKYFSHFVFTSDSLVTEWKKKNKSVQWVPRRIGQGGKYVWWSEYLYSEYFKDFPRNTFTEYARMPAGIPDYQYSENIPTQNWEIADDTLTVCGYVCQKAVCSFRGRNFTAWFTMDIPVNNGPWKFGGLPGLILKVYDADQQYTFECIRIENLLDKFPIMIYNYEGYSKMDRKKLLQFQKDLHEDYFKFADIVMTDGAKQPEKSVYYPIELE
jgi:GLPGLI family protein